MVHSRMRVTNEQLLARWGHDDGGRRAWRSIDPQFVLEGLVLHPLKELVQGWVELLRSDPGLQGPWHAAFDFVERVVLQGSARLAMLVRLPKLAESSDRSRCAQ